ncbi:MAG: fatty acid oxidation complex subunit alpha FadJ [Deltaproteobacteria bacterium]|nr:fatty acid oxidation complex subunit alpha FadJ [Deltaproteobacteria bacterium]
MTTTKTGDRDMNLTHFRFDVDIHGVATALMDVEGEKVNTLSPKVSEDLGKIIERVETDTAIKALVIGSAKESAFIVGADVKMLNAATSAADVTRLSHEAQRGFARVEALHREWNKPVVAAIHGPALGGGLELALACSLRILSDAPETAVGLPEIQLGLFPGAGGTQRLPRLIGIANALDLILTGKKVRAKKAVKLGVADEVVPAPLLLTLAKERARQAAQGLLPPKATGLMRLKELAASMTDPEHLQHLALEDNPVGQRILFKKALDATRAKTRGNYPAAEKAIEVVRIGIQEGIEAGYAAEADRFGQVAMTPQAKALMSIFFATQELKKDSGTADPSAVAKPVRKVGVLGGGLMGGGIAAVTLTNAKLPVRIKEVDDAGVARGFKYVAKNLETDVRKKRRSAREAEQLIAGLSGTTEMAGFADAQVIIEAVFEDLGLKQRILKDTEANTGAETIFASNTSSLPITKIAEASAHPETVIGMHYFSPVEKMPLLEIIVTKKTAPWVTATCVQLGKEQGKTVIVVNDGTGFYTSRILAPYMNEAAHVLAEGATIEEIDEALMDWGFPVGPIVLLDEVGIDVGAKVAKIMHEAFGARMTPPAAMETLIKDQRYGRKNSRGFYLYENGKKAGVDTSVYAVIGHSRSKTPLAKKDIQRRIGLQMVNEAARCLEEGILRSPRDGDVGAIFGLGFPPFLGGPFWYVDQVGAGEIVRRLEQLADKHGSRFAPAAILESYAKAGKKFRA